MLTAASTSSGYEARGGGSAIAASETGPDHERLKRQYLNYLEIKNAEIKEQQDSRRYYHGSQWTSKQVAAFNKRRQPVVTYNRVGRKINAVIGLLEKQRADPRAFPRTPQHEAGAEIATATIRFVLDDSRWPEKSAACGLSGAVDGIGGIELLMQQGDDGDPTLSMETVDPASFFYDPRSLLPDFSDARFMGVGKWADVETVAEMFPDKADAIRSAVETGTDLTSNPDSDAKWIDGGENNRKIRLVDHWYIRNGKWHWCVYTGVLKLASGESPYIDEDGNTFCKYLMYSANVDHDGDRYGFVRNMKSAQDEINQRRSKGLHILNSRRLIIADGVYKDVEELRREAARPDGVIRYPPGQEKPEFDDNARGNELQGQIAFLQDAKEEIENYGFNPALVGTGVQDMSGRAIQLQQQAGIAELGPFLLSFRAWKIRVYRAVWNIIQRFWKSERFVRVTDDEKVAQFFAVNKLAIDPRTGRPAIVNALGALDVDIIIDEGPDTVNMQADAYDTLSLMASKGQAVPPEILIELSPLHGSKKQKVLEMLAKAKQNPLQEAAAKLELAGKQAETAETEASAKLKQAQAIKAIADAQSADMPQGEGAPDLSSLASIEVARIRGESDLNKTAMQGDIDMARLFAEQAHDRRMAAMNSERERAAEPAR